MFPVFAKGSQSDALMEGFKLKAFENKILKIIF
jgi:hypothetical protein